MDWSKEETLELIEACKKRPLLWDYKHQFYYVKEKHNETWFHLSDELNKSPDECKRKWKNLITLFQYEKVKMKNNDYITSWYAFEALQFLDKINPMSSKYSKSNESKDPLNIKDEIEDSADIKANSQSQSDIFETEIGMTQMIQENDLKVKSNSYETEEESDRRKEQEIVFRRINNKKKSCEKRKKRKKEDRRLESSVFNHFNSVDSRMINDDPQIFGNLVTVKLRRYDPLTISLIQNAILRIFVDADKAKTTIPINTKSIQNTNVSKSITPANYLLSNNMDQLSTAFSLYSSHHSMSPFYSSSLNEVKVKRL